MEQKKENQVVEKNAQEICERIRLDVGVEVEGIMVSARRDATRILEDARSSAAKEKETLIKQFDHDSRLLRERLFSTINLEKRKIILGAKSAFIEEVFARVRDVAARYRTRHEYRDFLIQSASEGIVAIGTESVEVVCSSLDEALLGEAFLKTLGDSVRARPSGREILITLTKDTGNDIGCIVRAGDGHLICDNRFMARFARMREELRMLLLKEAI